MRKIFAEFAMSTTTVRWTLTTVYHGLSVMLQSVTIGSMYSCLGFTTDPEGLGEWFVKITIQLKNQAIKESLKR